MAILTKKMVCDWKNKNPDNVIFSVPEEITEMESEAFFFGGNIEKIIISKNVSTIPENAFAGIKLKQMEISKDNDCFAMIGVKKEFFIDKKNKALVKCFSNEETVELPHGIESVRNNAFNENVKKIIINSRLKIGKNAALSKEAKKCIEDYQKTLADGREKKAEEGISKILSEAWKLLEDCKIPYEIEKFYPTAKQTWKSANLIFSNKFCSLHFCLNGKILPSENDDFLKIVQKFKDLSLEQFETETFEIILNKLRKKDEMCEGMHWSGYYIEEYFMKLGKVFVENISSECKKQLVKYHLEKECLAQNKKLCEIEYQTGYEEKSNRYSFACMKDGKKMFAYFNLDEAICLLVDSKLHFWEFLSKILSFSQLCFREELQDESEMKNRWKLYCGFHFYIMPKMTFKIEKII